MKKELKRNCNSCRHGTFADCDELKNNVEFQEIYQKSTTDAFVWKDDHICDDYKCKYIVYPIEVSEIKYETETGAYGSRNVGKFVKIKPCKEEKTFLGLYLGELPLGIRINHNSETKALTASYDSNPAIFVFDLNKIVYGAESWWGVIENESDLQEITDLDIENVWYVKALKVIS